MVSKILTRADAAKVVAERQAKGEKAVFTNGCFDLLHIGHIRYLQEARWQGDFLLVAINSDASVRGLKGPLRPLVSEGERAEVLAALACVDYVTMFDEPDPSSLLREVQPEILVKGGDWPIEQVVGRDLVEGRGGRVLTIPIVSGASTSRIIDRILERYTQK